MFSYIDESIRKILVENHKIRTIGGDGGPRLSVLGPIPLPVLDRETGREHSFRWYPFVRHTELDSVDRISRDVRDGDTNDLIHLLNSYMQVNSLLLHGDFEHAPEPLVRVHSCCMTGDVFGSRRCECGPQLDAAYARVFEEGVGAVIYMASHEGRGIGLWAKGVTYILQDMGQDTYQANESLGLPADSRDFSDAAIVLDHFLAEGARIRLLSNNPMKVEQLSEGGIEISEQISLVAGVCHYNVRYLHAKREHGHAFDEESLPDPDQ